jgi:uncharacterized membrane protein
VTSRQRIEYGALWALAIVNLPVGVQAAFAPRSFFDDFPLGRGWISADGALYNEHLVRDVGVLYLALIIATAWTAWKRGPSRPLAVAWLVQGVLHVGFHIHHLHGFDTIEQVALIGSLLTIPILAAVCLWAGRRDVSLGG